MTPTSYLRRQSARHLIVGLLTHDWSGWKACRHRIAAIRRLNNLIATRAR